MSEAPIQQALQASAEELGIKVFVGNVSFKTTSEDLKETFSTVGEVLTAQVITRGNRSLGYAFVEFKNEDDASKAVSKFDKSQLNDRTINVEIAKPAKHAPGGGVAEAAAEAGAARGRGRGRRGTGRRVQPDGEADGGADHGVNGVTEGVAALSTGEEGTGTSRRGGGRGRGRGRGGRVSRGPVGPPQGEPSSTLLFVANLPWQLDSDGLKEVFKAYKVTSAHVVVRKSGHLAGRSKGFGFVEVENEHEQKRAVEEMNDKQVETPSGNRTISVKVAIKAEAQEEGADPSTTATVTTTSAADAAANA